MNRPAPLPVVRAAELEASSPEARWLIETLWPLEGVGVIGGSPKSLKTWAGLELATSIASNTPCLGAFAVKAPGMALVYLAEERLPVVRERLEALCAHRRLPLEHLDLGVITSPSLRLDLEADVERLEATLDRLRPRLLLLDPLVRLHRGDENSAQEIASLLARLRELQRRYQVAIILVHHTRKNGRTRQQGQALRGSGDLHAWGDTGLYLTHQGSRLQLTIEHRAAPAPEPLFLELTGNPPHLELCEPPGDDQPTLEDTILSALRRAPGPLRRTELRSMLGVNNKRLGDALQQLEQLGRIRRAPNGWHA